MSLLLLGAFSATAVAQGNSEAAQSCQQGGYLTLARADGMTFKNAGQCTSYVAQGGTLTQANPVITVAFRLVPEDSRFWLIDVTLTGFRPNTT